MIERLRDRLAEVDFTVDAVGELLGPAAHAALLRNETTPARRATADGSALSTLVRLFQLQLPVPRESAERALPGSIADLVEVGLLGADGSDVHARADLRPYGDDDHDWWVVCDLTPGLDTQPVVVGPDHVLGISEASSSLARLTVRRDADRVLDLGTGCGVQALHLAGHSREVVATDVNPRALWAARLTTELNGVDADVRQGSLYEPVAGERFDLVVTNPPFVVSPPSDDRLVYRESDLPGDDVVRRIVAGAHHHLRPDGWCQVLASWMHTADRPWEERLQGWIEPTGLDAWVVQREVVDLPAYVEMWLADAGLRHRPDYVRRYDEWLSWFAEQGVEAMAFGWIDLRNAGREAPVVRTETWQHDVAGSMGPAVLAWADRVDALADADDVLAACWRQVPGLVQETFGPAGATDPEAIVLRLAEGPRRARQVDTVEAGLVGALDGELTAGQVLDALATLLERDADELRERYRPVVHDLVADGYLH
ncbi:class I SAM-dependent methyltransferase [Aeromicrobium halocynthiae]|uniref:Class I SAM-dependent methyltransferase n=1 Tax=Aeromicrobium halocynthiae TaxID=560557 RepID=A0ABN2W233_9ACTN